LARESIIRKKSDLDLAVAPPIKVKLCLKFKAAKDPIKVTIPARDKMINIFKRLKDIDDVGAQQPKCIICNGNSANGNGSERI